MSPAAALDAPAWLTSGPVARLLALLGRDGEDARVVGGAVRNALLGLAVDEIDVATTARPEEVMRRAMAAGYKALATGIEHGTVTVVVEGRPIEVTTLRKDVETFGRKARVVFGRDWKADAERRDFTINALSVTADGIVHDDVGGLADIAARRIRFIGEAQFRIEEDFLRILRFFRFHAHFSDHAPEPAGLLACIRARSGLATLSRERVRMELMKLLVGRHATPTLAVMANSGLLGMVLGGIAFLASFENMTKAEAAVGEQPDAVRRLGALAVVVKEDAERLSERLRLSNAEFDRLAALDRWWRLAPAAGEQARHALLYRLGPQSYVDRVLLAWSRAQAGVADAVWRDLALLPQRWTAPTFPIKAAAFMCRGLPPGPLLGAALRTAEEEWIAADFPREHAALEAIVDQAMLKHAASG